MSRPVLTTARIWLEPMTSEHLPLRIEHRERHQPLPGADQGDVVHGITRESWPTEAASRFSPISEPMTPFRSTFPDRQHTTDAG